MLQAQVPWELVPDLSHCSLKFGEKKTDLSTTVAAAHFLHGICDGEIKKEILKQPQPPNYRPNNFHKLFFGRDGLVWLAFPAH